MLQPRFLLLAGRRQDFSKINGWNETLDEIAHGQLRSVFFRNMVFGTRLRDHFVHGSAINRALSFHERIIGEVIHQKLVDMLDP
jgi:hypothetical protein